VPVLVNRRPFGLYDGGHRRQRRQAIVKVLAADCWMAKHHMRKRSPARYAGWNSQCQVISRRQPFKKTGGLRLLESNLA
jgi:hypothetical protein